MYSWILFVMVSGGGAPVVNTQYFADFSSCKTAEAFERNVVQTRGYTIDTVCTPISKTAQSEPVQ